MPRVLLLLSNQNDSPPQRSYQQPVVLFKR